MALRVELVAFFDRFLPLPLSVLPSFSLICLFLRESRCSNSICLRTSLAISGGNSESTFSSTSAAVTPSKGCVVGSLL